MKTRVQKWGNSLALRIPKAFAAELSLQANAAVELRLVEGVLIVQPIAAQPLTLDELLRGSHQRKRPWRVGYRAGFRQGSLVSRKAFYIPERGDAVWITLDPQAGHERIALATPFRSTGRGDRPMARRPKIRRLRLDPSAMGFRNQVT